MLRLSALLALAAMPLAGADRLELVRTAVRSGSTAGSSASSTSTSTSTSRRDACAPAYAYASASTAASEAGAGEDGMALDVASSLAVEGGWQEGVGRLGARFALDVDTTLALGVGGDRFYERDGARWDRLDLARIDGALTVASSRFAALRLGGVGYLLHDPHGNDRGLAALAGFHVGGFRDLPALGFDARVEAGFVGSATLLRARGALGWRLGALEPELGYDYLRLDHAALQGPFVGLCWHF